MYGGLIGRSTEDVKDALEENSKPDIINTDKGSQLASNEFRGLLVNNGISIRMDEKGRTIDNIFIARLWQLVRFEQVCLIPDREGVELYKG